MLAADGARLRLLNTLLLIGSEQTCTAACEARLLLGVEVRVLASRRGWHRQVCSVVVESLSPLVLEFKPPSETFLVLFLRCFVHATAAQIVGKD